MATSKSTWETRWHNILKEKLLKFMVTADYQELSSKLREAGVLPEGGFQKHQDWQDFDLYDPRRAKWGRTAHYGDFVDHCRRLGKKYGLSWQTIFQSVFLPESEVRIESFVKPEWKLRPIFSYKDRQYYDLLGNSDVEGGWTLEWIDDADLGPEIDLSKVDPYSIFKLVIEVPLDYPPEGIRAMQEEGRRKARAFCAILGHEIKQRMKTSPKLERLAQVLKISRERPCSLKEALDEFYREERGLDLKKTAHELNTDETFDVDASTYYKALGDYDSDLRQLYRLAQELKELEET